MKRYSKNYLKQKHHHHFLQVMPNEPIPPSRKRRGHISNSPLLVDAFLRNPCDKLRVFMLGGWAVHPRWSSSHPVKTNLRSRQIGKNHVTPKNLVCWTFTNDNLVFMECDDFMSPCKPLHKSLLKKNKAKGTELLGNSLVHSKVNVAICYPWPFQGSSAECLPPTSLSEKSFPATAGSNLKPPPVMHGLVLQVLHHSSTSHNRMRISAQMCEILPLP